MSTWFYAEPIDTLFFRDGRPFERGVESVASSIFPPSPGTLYGALRTLIIMTNSTLANYANDDSLKAIIGDSSSLGSLRLVGPFLCKKTKYGCLPLVPVPKDLLYDKESERLIKINPCLNLEDDIKYNNPLNLSLTERNSDGFYIKGDEIEGFLSLDLFYSYYLLGNFTGLSGYFERLEKKNDSYFFVEDKIGIKLDNTTNTSELHCLYSSHHIRFGREIGLIFGVENDNGKMPDGGKFRFGGETRLVRFEKNTDMDNIITKINESAKGVLKDNKHIKFVLITPAIFEKGWIPDFLDDKFEGTLHGTNVKLKLISCMLGRNGYIGGFDLAKGYPKEMKKAVPIGSVYFFEVVENENQNLDTKIDELINLYNFNSIETREDFLKQGFGQIIIGGW
ncbi:MAG: type III-B CRISPR module-associated protein Cmr3 [archaeon]